MAARRPPPADATMSFGDHLEELRHRVLLAILAPIPLSIVTYLVSDTLIEWLLLPLYRVLRRYELPEQVQVLGAPEFIATKIKISIIAALIISGPWILWQAWLFISPGLYHHEKRFVYLLIPGSAILTVAGVVLMYFAMLPLMLQVLVGMAAGEDLRPSEPVDARVAQVLETNPEVKLLTAAPAAPSAGEVWAIWPRLERGFVAVAGEGGGSAVEVLPLIIPSGQAIVQQFRLREYISFVMLLFLAIVLAFQMPLVVLLLGWIGLASAPWLRQKRKYALLVCAFIAAVITPPDVISMMVMLVPLYGLYELGILLLVLAPASKVAEGRVFAWSRRGKASGAKGSASHNRREPPDQPRKPVQADRIVPRQSAPADQPENPADGGGES